MVLNFPDTTLHLLPELAVFEPSSATLCVADLHLGKSAVFRDAGLALPDGPDAETLEALSAVIRRHSPRRVVVLGDVFHDRIRQCEELQALLNTWRLDHAAVNLTIVPGNHDRRICWDEWLPGAEVLPPGSAGGACAFFHHPPDDAQTLALCGHLHPGISLGRRGMRRVTAPCFRLQEKVLTLPAFGKFTGLQVLPRSAAGRFFVSVRETVVEVPFMN